MAHTGFSDGLEAAQAGKDDADLRFTPLRSHVQQSRTGLEDKRTEKEISSLNLRQGART